MSTRKPTTWIVFVGFLRKAGSEYRAVGGFLSLLGNIIIFLVLLSSSYHHHHHHHHHHCHHYIIIIILSQHVRTVPTVEMTAQDGAVKDVRTVSATLRPDSVRVDLGGNQRTLIVTHVSGPLINTLLRGNAPLTLTLHAQGKCISSSLMRCSRGDTKRSFNALLKGNASLHL